MITDLSEYVASRVAILDRVRQILRDTMKLQIEPEAIDPDAPLFGTGLGMDSVDAVELVVQLDAVFGLELANSPLASTRIRTVNTIVDAIMEASKTGKIGDGKIFVNDLADSIRIRTGESGEKAL